MECRHIKRGFESLVICEDVLVILLQGSFIPSFYRSCKAAGRCFLIGTAISSLTCEIEIMTICDEALLKGGGDDGPPPTDKSLQMIISRLCFFSVDSVTSFAIKVFFSA